MSINNCYPSSEVLVSCFTSCVSCPSFLSWEAGLDQFCNLGIVLLTEQLCTQCLLNFSVLSNIYVCCNTVYSEGVVSGLPF